MRTVFRWSLFILIVLLGSCNSSKSLSQIDSESSSNLELLHIIDSLESELKNVSQNPSTHHYEPGKRYFRCRNSPQFESADTLSYLVYTGEDNQQEGIELVQIETRPAYLDWEKISEGPVCEGHEFEYDICDLWFYKEMPAVYKPIYIVTDTSTTKEYELRKYPITAVLKNGHLSMGEVICPSICFPNITLLGKVQTALRKRGYNLEGAIDFKIDKITKDALLDYQRKNRLPIGALDIETLKSLGVNN